MSGCPHPKSWGAKMCRACHLKAKWADPAFRVRQAAAARKALEKLRGDPAFREREAARLASGRRKAVEDGALHTIDANTKRGRTHTARKLSWCPPHLRDEYRHLLMRKKIPAAEARRIILAEWDAQLAARSRTAA